MKAPDEMLEQFKKECEVDNSRLEELIKEAILNILNQKLLR